MSPEQTAEAVFRAEHGRILAALIRIAGSFERAEEAMQEAFASALSAWPEKGIPRNPAAWITTAAHRKLIDESRRERTRREKQEPLRYETPSSTLPQDGADDEDAMHLPDDRLRLIFTCCHPALSTEAQVALTLRTLGGLTVPEIAKAFLVPEPTMAQRLVRAKRKIQEARIPYVVPPAPELPERLAGVQTALYLIFNEGYAAASGHQLVRRDLCNEAIRLARLLCELLPRQVENLGLLALMLLHDSRRNARLGAGRLITLEEQDRSLWDAAEIAEGLRLVERTFHAAPPGPYCLQAAIAALHAEAAAPGATDWPQIRALYGELLRLNPSPVIALNRAVAVAMSGDPQEALREIDALAELDRYYLLHAARADILRRMGKFAASAAAYRRALELAVNEVEREFLRRRLAQVAS